MTSTWLDATPSLAGRNVTSTVHAAGSLLQAAARRKPKGPSAAGISIGGTAPGNGQRLTLGALVSYRHLAEGELSGGDAGRRGWNWRFRTVTIRHRLGHQHHHSDDADSDHGSCAHSAPPGPPGWLRGVAGRRARSVGVWTVSPGRRGRPRWRLYRWWLHGRGHGGADDFELMREESFAGCVRHAPSGRQSAVQGRLPGRPPRRQRQRSFGSSSQCHHVVPALVVLGSLKYRGDRRNLCGDLFGDRAVTDPAGEDLGRALAILGRSHLLLPQPPARKVVTADQSALSKPGQQLPGISPIRHGRYQACPDGCGERCEGMEDGILGSRGRALDGDEDVGRLCVHAESACHADQVTVRGGADQGGEPDEFQGRSCQVRR